jgi:centractin
MARGIVQDQTDMQAVWEHTYRELKIMEDQHPVLITEAPLNPDSNKKLMLEVFFEKFQAPMFSVQSAPILNLYASGRTTGLVLDCGDGLTSATPVVEGYAVTHAMQRSDVGGRDVTEYLQLLLRKAGYPMHTSSELQEVRHIKETKCLVVDNLEREEQLLFSSIDLYQTPFTLPDGSAINLSAEKFRAPEVLFDPALIGT